MAFRPEFVAALTLLAKAAARLEERGLSPPVLVGGAAVELYTGGVVTSGDFDFVSPWQVEFFAELRQLGFERPKKPGWLARSLLHPTLGFGVQVVSGALMDGLTDSRRIAIVGVARDGERQFTLRVIPAEDLIADRIAQALSGMRRVDEVLRDQAVSLYQLAESLDRDYLDQRIRAETGGEASLATLVDWERQCAP